MRRTFCLVGLSLLLASCLHVAPIRFKGPNGREAYSMECSGAGRTLAECYNVAGKICPNGYDIIDRGSNTIGVPSQYGTTIITKQSIAIECR